MNIEEISQMTLAEIDEPILKGSGRILSWYSAYYEEMRQRHEKYRTGWHSPFMSHHRFLNRVVLRLLSGYKGLVLDVGCYDGMLVSLLNRQNVNAYGYEEIPWPEMYFSLGIASRVNRHPCTEYMQSAPRAECGVALNYAQRYRPEDFILTIEAISAVRPALVLTDREKRTPNPNNALWMDDALLESLGWQIWTFPKCAAKDPKQMSRHLLIWRNQ